MASASPPPVPAASEDHDGASHTTPGTNPEDDSDSTPTTETIPISTSAGSRAYAQLFLDARPPPDMPLAEALATGRARCVTVAAMVGGPMERVRRIEDFSLPCGDGSGRSFPVRVYLPTLLEQDDEADEHPREKKLGMVLYAHGGGMIVGCLASYDTLCRRLATRSGACVVSVGYSLAPEHPYPSGLLDCEAAYRWMVSTLSNDLYPDLLDPTRVALVGDSAGGHLCAALAVRLQRLGADLSAHVRRPKATALIYPALDFTLTAPSHKTFARCGHLNPESMNMMLRAYLSVPDEPGRFRSELLTHPEVSALFLPQEEVAATFPPTLLLAAACDPIVDDSAAFEARLKAAWVPVRRVVYPDVIHGFWSGWDLFPEAGKALEEACAWLREYGVGR